MDKIKAFFKKFFTSKQFRYGSNAFVMTIAFIGILFIINLFVSNQGWKLDISKDKKFTLSQETKDYLKTVKKEVKIIAFYDIGKEPQDVKDTLNDYKKYCSALKVEYADPDQNPALAKKYSKDGAAIDKGTMVVESGEKFRKLKQYDMYDMDYQTGELKASKVEQKLTGAISYVTSEKDPVIYMLGGHGEMGLESSTVVKTALEDVNYTIKNFDLVSAASVPADADIVSIVAPKKDLSADEKAKLDQYLDKGGRMMVFLEPFVELPNLSETLKKFNIGIDNDIAIETDAGKVVFNYPLNLKPEIVSSDLTSSIASKNLNIVFPEARSLKELKNKQDGLKLQSLAKTSDKSWGETNLKDQSPKLDGNDIPGPLDLAFSAEKNSSNADQKTRVVVFGDSTFLTDEAFEKLGAVGNYDLFVNSLSWLGERKDAVVVSSKFLSNDRLEISTITQVALVLVVVALIPILAIVAGVVIWVRRRHL
ncbi:MAG: GldG family protein [Clostridia bacterium]|nr:GldG family protein [Clostridia bacterium]